MTEPTSNATEPSTTASIIIETVSSSKLIKSEPTTEITRSNPMEPTTKPPTTTEGQITTTVKSTITTEKPKTNIEVTTESAKKTDVPTITEIETTIKIVNGAQFSDNLLNPKSTEYQDLSGKLIKEVSGCMITFKFMNQKEVMLL